MQVEWLYFPFEADDIIIYNLAISYIKARVQLYYWPGSVQTVIPRDIYLSFGATAFLS